LSRHDHAADVAAGRAVWKALAHVHQRVYARLRRATKKWKPVFRQGHAPLEKIRACTDANGTGHALMMSSTVIVEPQHFLRAQIRWHPLEIAFWLATLAPFVIFPNYLQLASQIAITALFALSLDLILGYAGIVSLGHAMFFGLGAYTAGLI